MGTPAPRGGLSLYADLLEGADSSASKQQEQQPSAQDEQKTGNTQAASSLASALRFQPIRRPQLKQPNKPKPTFPKAFTAAATAATATSSGANATTNTTPTTTPATAQPGTAAAPPQRSTLADWTANDDDDYLYGGQYRERGGRRKKKKKNDNVPEETNWEEYYDPARPTNVEEYLQGDERYREIQDWKYVLYAHRRNRRGSTRSRSRSRSRSWSRSRSRSRSRYRSRSRSYDSRSLSDREDDRRPIGNFAPPASLSFAPPPVSPPGAPAPAIPVPDDATGDDAYARRLALSGMGPSAPSTTSAPLPPPPPPDFYQAPPPPPPPAPVPAVGVISREAVTYEPPKQNPGGADEMDMDIDDDEDYNYVPPPIGAATANDDDKAQEDEQQQQPRSNRPGQADFAARLMSKYGWTKGSGLGADESGITSALRVKIEKRRRKPDAEGGGFAEPGGRGKIIGGTPAKKKDGESSGGGGKFGKTSVVIALDNMLANMTDDDLEAEIESGELKQDIGQECGEKYGRIERISIDPAEKRVFIKFTDQVSALRAVNDLEGRIFNGSAIAAKFFDLDEFENGVYR